MEALTFDARFVTELPGDPEPSNRCREVTRACYSRVAPTPVSAPRLRVLVPEVAASLGLSTEVTPTLVEVLAGNRIVDGMQPYAACYGGHQFGQWAGQLGDGRAITLGEIVAPGGERLELQLKGAGVTPYSRRADGRAVLRSSLRELVCSEAMHHLGVPTTRALSLVTTGDAVVRDILYDGHPAPEPGAIVCRVAPSFLRLGSFEIHASRGDAETLRALTRFALREHYPWLVDGERLDLPGFVAEVGRRTARMIVGWMRVGFVHGVMNTDNLSILGLTIDYGPYGWLEGFDPGWTPNTTDAGGRRYRFGNQPRIAQWNLVRFAEALAHLVDDTAPLALALGAYGDELRRLEPQMMASKLGLCARPELVDEDDELTSSLFAALGAAEIDMTLFFRRLADVDLGPSVSTEARLAPVAVAFYDADAARSAAAEPLALWLERYAARARGDLPPDERRATMHRANPIYVPRNYLVHEVIEAATRGDDAPLERLMDVLRAPYDERPGLEAYAAKRPDWARSVPGCSMLSCSS
ncbi:MAG: YdiU family protein [Polyangiaceae bacterium]|nr:YdiU family protein [Polyangiaceae bacterium]